VGKANGSRECAPDGVPTRDVAMVGTARSARLCPPYDCCMPSVIAGLDPAIHPLRKILAKMMDARVKPAHDEVK
jgi:hypothetical protein